MITVIGNFPFQQTCIGNFPSEQKLTSSNQAGLQKIEILLTQRFKQLQLHENNQSAVL